MLNQWDESKPTGCSAKLTISIWVLGVLNFYCFKSVWNLRKSGNIFKLQKGNYVQQQWDRKLFQEVIVTSAQTEDVPELWHQTLQQSELGKMKPNPRDNRFVKTWNFFPIISNLPSYAGTSLKKSLKTTTNQKQPDKKSAYFSYVFLEKMLFNMTVQIHFWINSSTYIYIFT